MEASSCSSNPTMPDKKGKGKGKGNSGKCRRVWTRNEEMALIGALKELKGKGFKVDNAFKAGYLMQLEGLMRKVIPDTDIRADPQIKSKLTVWKKTYSHLYSLFDGSGGGASLNPLTKMIEVVSEDFWSEYIRVHPYVTSYRLKRFPLFDDWAEVFGKDRATGAGAEDISAAVQELLNSHNLGNATAGPSCGANGSSQTQQNPIDLDSYEGAGDNDLPIPGPPPVDAKLIYKKIKKEKGVMKRKSSSMSDSSAPEVPPYMDEFIKKTQHSIDRLADMFVQPPAKEDVASKQRRTIYSSLEEIPDFDEEQKMVLAHKLAHSPEDADIYFSLSDVARPKYLRMLLKKKMVR